MLRKDCSRTQTTPADSDRSHVQALMESALSHGSIAKKARHDLVRFAHLESERHACGERNSACDNCDARDHPLFHISHMHRAAFPSTAPGRRAKQFVEHFSRREPFGQRVAVASEGRCDKVIFIQSCADANGRSFLTAWP